MYNFEDRASGELAVVRDLIPPPQFGTVFPSHPRSDFLIETLEKYRDILNNPNTLSELPKDEDNANTIKAFNIEFEKLTAVKASPESEVASILVRELQILSKLIEIGQNVALRPEATASV